LDEDFINKQLNVLAKTWKNSILKSHIYLKNGNPIIRSFIGELGGVTDIKNELLKYFESVTEEKMGPLESPWQ
jgi:hypothetical protein